MCKEDGIRAVYDHPGIEHIDVDVTVLPEAVTPESGEVDDESNDHLRELENGDAPCDACWDTVAQSLDGIIGVHDGVNTEIHATKPDPNGTANGSAQAIERIYQDSAVVIPV